MIDLNGFWTYENREVLVQETPEEAEVWPERAASEPTDSSDNAASGHSDPATLTQDEDNSNPKYIEQATLLWDRQCS